VAGNPVRVYDVAHNAAGARALAGALTELGVPEGSVLVLGVLGDKDLAEMAAEYARHFRRAIATTPPHPLRARPAEETAAALAAAGLTVEVREDVGAAMENAVELVVGGDRGGAAGVAGTDAAGGWVFATGSLFTVGAAMKACGDRAERGSHPRAENIFP
jgi:folylpolyglutamate synthase/dihydropteroate synthase